MSVPDTAEAPEVPAAPDRIWSAIADALRGSQHDYTAGPIPRAILMLAIPMVLEMALESVFAVTDVFFVGRLGPDAVATVGITESMLALIYAVDLGLSMGAAATVARRIGERDRDGAARAAVQAVWLGLVASLIIGVIGAVFAPRFLSLMGAPPGVVANVGYTRIMLGFSGTITMLFLLNAIFRGAGDAAIAMRVLWFANSINILLGPCLIFGLGPFPRLGVLGAATATTIGRASGAVFALTRLVWSSERIPVRRVRLTPDPAIMGGVLRLSVSGAIQAFVGTASWIGVVRIVSRFGSEALAGYTIAFRMIIFALLPSWGISNAAATMVGQALGAKKPDRAARAVWLTGWYDCAVLTVAGLIFVVFAKPLVSLFSTDPTVLATGVACLRIVAVGFPFYAFGMVITQAFNGAGDTWTPTLINVVVFWLWEIPLAYVLAVTMHRGVDGVFVAMLIAFSSLAVVSALLFRRGTWQKTRV
jgi:putative MATE family efflux protein